MEKKFTSLSEDQTKTYGQRFAEELKPGAIVCLKGDLGAGKTYFVKGMARAFNIPEQEVHSPTYTLINEYHGDLMLYHFDCYRMESPEEALEIGAEEYFYNGGVCVIEWPERISSILPDDVIWISIEAPTSETRKFVISKKG